MFFTIFQLKNTVRMLDAQLLYNNLENDQKKNTHEFKMIQTYVWN